MHAPLSITAYAYKPSNQDVEEQQKFKVIFSYVANLKPA